MALIEQLMQRLAAASGDTHTQSAVAAELVLVARPEPERGPLRSALDAAVVLRWFDASLMKKVLEIPDDDARKLFEELKTLPFVERYRMAERDILNVHESTRLGWRKQLAQEWPERFANLSARAARCFADDFTTAGRIDWIYHLLCGDPKRGTTELELLDHNWKSCPRPEDRYALASALRELEDTRLVQGVARVWVLLVTAWVPLIRGEAAQLTNRVRKIVNLARAAEEPRVEAHAQCLLGDVLQTQGKLEAARGAFGKYLTISRRLAEQDPSNWDWQRESAVAHSRVGRVLQAQGRLKAAQAAFGKGMAISRHLAEQDPSNAGWQRELAVAHSSIGDVLQSQGKLEAAQAAFGEYLTINRRLAEQDPSNSDWQRELAMAHSRVGRVLQAQGRLEAAQAAFGEYLTISRRLVEQDPSNSDWQRDLAIAYSRVGDLLQTQGKLEAAQKVFGEYLTISRRLTEQDPSNSDWQRELAVAYNRIANVLQMQGKLGAAKGPFEEYLTISRRLAEQEPSNSDSQRELAVAFSRVGDVLRTQGKPIEIIVFCSGERELHIAERLLTERNCQGPFMLGKIGNIEDLVRENMFFEVVQEDSQNLEDENVEPSANQIPLDAIIKGVAGMLVRQLPSQMPNHYIVEIHHSFQTDTVPELPSAQMLMENADPVMQFTAYLTFEQAKKASKLPPVERLCLRRASHKLAPLSLKPTPRQIRFSPATLYARADDSSWRERFSDEPDKPRINPIPNLEKWVQTLVAFDNGLSVEDNGSQSIEERNERAIYSELRHLADKEGRTYLGTESLPRLIQALYTLTYEHARRGKLLEHNYRCDLEEAVAADSNKIPSPDCLPSCPTSRPIWVQVIALCQTIINLCRSISAELVHLEFGWRVNIYMLNSLALARLGRFTEARRCLNESNALLSKLPRRLDQVELAAIELRRAEVHLLEAIFLARLLDALCDELLDVLPTDVNSPIRHLRLLLQKGDENHSTAPDGQARKIAHQWFLQYEMKSLRPPKAIFRPKTESSDIDIDLVRNSAAHLSHIHFAQLDDASVALEHAEQLLAGRTRSSQWWGRLCTLRLRVFAEHWSEERLKQRYDNRQQPQSSSTSRLEIAPKRCATMAFRRKIDYPHYFISLLRLGLAVWPDDPHRRLRLADYFISAWKRWKNTPEKIPDEAPELTLEARMLLKEAYQQGSYSGQEKDPEKYALLNRYRKVLENRVDLFINLNAEVATRSA